MSKKTIALIIILFLISGGLLYLAFWSKNGIPTFGSPLIVDGPVTPEPTPVAHTTLSLSPSTLIIASSSGSLNLVIDTSINNATAVQVELAYDPKAITTIDIIPGDFFTNPVTLLKSIDKELGKISYAIAISPTDLPKKGTGTVARLTFTTNLMSGEKTNFTFLPKTLVTGENIPISVLRSTTGATVFYVPQAQTPSATTSGQ